MFALLVLILVLLLLVPIFIPRYRTYYPWWRE
jgi:hypothetical protein